MSFIERLNEIKEKTTKNEIEWFSENLTTYVCYSKCNTYQMSIQKVSNNFIFQIKIIESSKIDMFRNVDINVDKETFLLFESIFKLAENNVQNSIGKIIDLF